MRLDRSGWSGRGQRRGWSARRIYILVSMLCAFGFIAAIAFRPRATTTPHGISSLRAAPSAELIAATRVSAATFQSHLVRTIQQQGHLTVTLHVGLTDGEATPSKFTNGDDPRTNLCWGALYGVDTHMANAAGWRRFYGDKGDGNRIIRRSIFSRRVAPSAEWVAAGVDQAFDVFVLANAWPASRLREAMSQPIRDACADGPVVITHDGMSLAFGSASCMVGYLGPNAMADAYWDPFEACNSGGHSRIGLFYLSSMSAVYLYDSAVRNGFYPVLFARLPIVPEAYLFDGMMQALLEGELDEGFLDSAARAYAKYQKSIPAESAASMLYQ